jgi:hypothetical protein
VGGDAREALKAAEWDFIVHGKGPPSPALAKFRAKMEQVIAHLENGTASKVEHQVPGRMYQVRINADPEQFLDWDKPLSQQSDAIKASIGKLPDRVRPLDPMEWENVSGERLVKRLGYDEPKATSALREAGIPGIRYLDQGSRGAGSGSYNYVVFDDSLIEITHKDGKPLSKAEKKELLSGVSDSIMASLVRDPNLDMSPEARKARAEAMGFDTSKVWYHGTTRGGFDRFDPAKGQSNNGWGGVSVTRNPHVADDYTGLDGGSVLPLYERTGTRFIWNLDDFRRGAKEKSETFSRARSVMPDLALDGDFVGGSQRAAFGQALRDAGYDGLDVVFGGEIIERVVFDPANIRSVNAAFDPAEEGSDLIMAAFPRVGQFRSVSPGSKTQYGTAPTTKPASTLSSLVADVTKALGLTVRHGRLNPGLKADAGRRGNVLAGQHSAATGVTRLALPNDLATLAHEGGHALEVRASTKAGVAALKRSHAEVLTVAPAPNRPAPRLPTQGFTGLEVDAETQGLLAQAVEADQALRLMAQAVPNKAAYQAAQDLAGSVRQVLIHRLGKNVADALIDDVANSGLAPGAYPAYIAGRYSASGTPLPRQALQPSPRDLSEGWAEWFRLYVTNPKQAEADAPRLFKDFEAFLDGTEPAMLEQIEAIQDGVEALQAASPAGAVMSRVQSTVKEGRIAALMQAIEEKGIRDVISDKVYGFYHAFFDGAHPMKRAVRHLLNLGAENLGLTLGANEKITLKAIDDPYKLWRLAEHSKVHATAALQAGIVFKGQVDPTGPSYHDALVQAFGGRKRAQWTSENVELFGSYLIARRMLAEFDRFDRGELEQIPDRVIDRAVWGRAKADLEKAYPAFALAAETLYKFNRNALRLKFEQGFLTPELYQDLLNRVDYVPLNRIMDDGAPSTLSKAKGQNKRRLIYRFQGSTRDFINPLESIAQDMYATQARIALNNVIGAMDRLSRAVGPGGGAIAERIPAKDLKGTKVDIREALKAAALKQNLSPDDRDGLMELIDDLFDQDASATIFRPTDTNEAGEAIVYYWEGGKRVPIRVGDNRIGRDIFEGMTAFGQANFEPFVDMAALGTSALRAGITKAPAYIIVNFLRDQIATWILSENFTPFATGAKGIKSAVANDDVAQRYQAFAGLMGGVDSRTIDALTSDRDVLSLRRKGFLGSPGKSRAGDLWYSFLRGMEFTETASRFGHFDAAYKRALGDGMTREEAAFEAAYAAHDVMDFSRRGAKMTSISRIVAFLNASLQGLDVARRTLFTSERDSATAYRKLLTPYLKGATGNPLTIAEKRDLPNSTRAWIKVVTVGMLGAALAAMYADDDEYEEFNDQMRATHWFFKVDGTWVRYPKPFELAFFSNLFEAAFARIWKNDARAAEQFTTSLWHTMIPPHEINVANLYYEWASGKDLFSGRDIVSMDLAKLPPEMQFNAYTSELGKMVGGITGMSPQGVDHFLAGILGTIGRDAQNLSDAVLPRINGAVGGVLPGVSDEVRADKSFEDWVIASRLTRRASRGALSTREFWDKMSGSGGELIQVAEGYKSLVRAGKARDARDFIEDLPDEERAYAVLEGEFTEKEQDLHPLNRARQVMQAASGLRKEMVSGSIVKQGTERNLKNRRSGREAEEIAIAPATGKVINEILEDISMREARNALIVTGATGWEQKDIMATDQLLAELRAASPEVADEFEARLAGGRNKVYSFEAVKKLWPEARDRLVRGYGDAELTDLIAEAGAY